MQAPSSPALPSPAPVPSLTLEQGLREAFIDAKLAHKWFVDGCLWARMDVHGIEISQQPHETYKRRWVVAVGSQPAGTGQLSALSAVRVGGCAGALAAACVALVLVHRHLKEAFILQYEC